MRKVTVLTLIALLICLASVAFAAPPTVGVVTSAVCGRGDAVSEKVNPWTSDFLQEYRVAVVSGPLVDKAVADLGIALSPGQEDTKDAAGVIPTVCQPEYLAQLGTKLGVDRMLGAHFKVWHRTHVGYRDGKCEISYTIVDVKSGKVLSAAVSPKFTRAADNDASYAGRVAVATTGALMAGGRAFYQWAPAQTVGWVALSAACLIPYESRCDAELAAIKGGIQGTFRPLIRLLRSS